MSKIQMENEDSEGCRRTGGRAFDSLRFDGSFWLRAQTLNRSKPLSARHVAARWPRRCILRCSFVSWPSCCTQAGWRHRGAKIPRSRSNDSETIQRHTRSCSRMLDARRRWERRRLIRKLINAQPLEHITDLPSSQENDAAEDDIRSVICFIRGSRLRQLSRSRYESQDTAVARKQQDAGE